MKLQWCFCALTFSSCINFIRVIVYSDLNMNATFIEKDHYKKWKKLNL